MLTRPQRIALDHHCRLATETMHPRFARLVHGGAFSVLVTVNSICAACAAKLHAELDARELAS